MSAPELAGCVALLLEGRPGAAPRASQSQQGTPHAVHDRCLSLAAVSDTDPDGGRGPGPVQASAAPNARLHAMAPRVSVADLGGWRMGRTWLPVPAPRGAAVVWREYARAGLVPSTVKALLMNTARPIVDVNETAASLTTRAAPVSFSRPVPSHWQWIDLCSVCVCVLLCSRGLQCCSWHRSSRGPSGGSM